MKPKYNIGDAVFVNIDDFVDIVVIKEICWIEQSREFFYNSNYHEDQIFKNFAGVSEKCLFSFKQIDIFFAYKKWLKGPSIQYEASKES